MNGEEIKEWIRVSRAGNGKVTVTVTLQQGTAVARWVVRSFSQGVKDGVAEARRGATSALEQIAEAL